MEEKDELIPASQEETPREEPAQEEETPKKSEWVKRKEGWYDKVPLNVKQLDIIIIVAWILLGLTILCIILDVNDVFHLFGE